MEVMNISVPTVAPVAEWKKKGFQPHVYASIASGSQQIRHSVLSSVGRSLQDGDFGTLGHRALVYDMSARNTQVASWCER